MVKEYIVLDKWLYEVKHTVKIQKREYGMVLIHYIENESGETIYWFESIIDAIEIQDGLNEKRITAYKNNKKLYEILIEADNVFYNIYEDQ